MLLIAAEETAGNRPTLRLGLRSFEGMFLDPHALRDFPPETSASTIPMRTNGCGARRNGCKLCSCSEESMVIVENSEPDTKPGRCRCESIMKFTRVRFTLDTIS